MHNSTLPPGSGAPVPKRIAFYADDPGEGGMAIYTHAMTCALARSGLDVTCIQSKIESPLQDIQRGLGVKHHWLPFQTRTDFSRTALDSRDAQQAFAAVRPDVVVFANCDPTSHIAAKNVAIEQRIPYIVEGYVYPIQRINPKITWCLPHAAEGYRRAKAVIAVSQENLNLLHRDFGLPQKKGQVIHFGRPAEYFRPPDVSVRQSLRRELGAGPEDVLCLTVGRLVPIKGYDCLLAAVEKLRSKPVWRRLRFAWIGKGKLEPQLRAGIEKLGVGNRVHLLGHRLDMVNWFDASDVFILASRCEGMPLSIMEAMAKGLPVIASSVSGIPEELGPTGRLVTSPVSDPTVTASEIAAILEAWAADPDLRRSLGHAGKARAETMFREERMVEQTMRLLALKRDRSEHHS